MFPAPSKVALAAAKGAAQILQQDLPSVVQTVIAEMTTLRPPLLHTGSPLNARLQQISIAAVPAAGVASAGVAPGPGPAAAPAPAKLKTQ